MKKHLCVAALTAALLPAFTACGGSDDARDAAPATTTDATDATGSPTAGAAGATDLSVTDPWVKAAPDGMTAAFGTLANDGTDDLTVVSAHTAAATSTELHETVENEDGSMAMRPKEGGFVIPAGGSLTLEPGGDHLMLMGLSAPVEPGTTLTLTLTLGDGSTATVEATVKAFDGADEQYQNGGEH
ncbi:copper chaperone PCu(A)C [Nocardioides carbamazepini]|uniref:copper chaperone PCu(A)C n=1 Tax=Nocardioides carbamazepini TaxID=2854259 RepID=UPI00214A7EBB|nr:copper chaperone PCu(A)C [Nocardioides carbamazepini]MCR1784378.1 copper chaperone PCu(A)C [Nocardioides carbamazepini]